MFRSHSVIAASLAALTLLLSLFASAVLAAPPASGQSRSPFEGDARLQKRVTLALAKVPLSEALAEIGSQAGVKLTALERAADEPVALYVKEQPAREVLRQIAELLGYYWTRVGKADEPRYELFQDLRSKQEEAAILSGARRKVIETLQAELRRHRRFADLPPEELKKRADAGDADLARMMGQGGGGGFGGSGQQSEQMHDWQAARNIVQPLGRILLGLLEGLTPAQWQQLLAEEPLVFSTEPKAGDLRLPSAMVATLKNTKPISPVPAAVARTLGGNVEEQIREAERRTAEEWARATGYRVDIQLTLAMGAQPMGFLRVAPQPLGGTRGLSALNGLNIFAIPDLKPGGQNPETPEARKTRLASDPVLAKKASLPPAKPDTASFMPFLQRTGEMLRRITEGYGINVVADAYTSGSISLGGTPPAAGAGGTGEGAPLYEMLDRAFSFQRDWVRDGDFIRLRSRTWAFDRNTEIPSRLMRRWAAAWKARDGWDLDQLAAVVDALRPEQIQTFELAAQEYGIPSGGQLFMLMMSADALRLYAHLLPAQRQALMAGRPLLLGSLTPAQRPYALDLARGRGTVIVRMFMGPPPWRSLQELARATLSLTGTAATAIPFPGAAPPAGAAPGQTPPRPAAPPRMMAIFELRFPEGRPETYIVPGVLPPGTPLPKREAEKKP